ncbi:MAG: 4'-phosphopantetheinyl transferase superfamily protein [Oscillospiraceae bacterium]|nr:4'-phosphopantetheinyl transferase superfamily protein [Oscillospiraceae bacterium]
MAYNNNMGIMTNKKPLIGFDSINNLTDQCYEEWLSLISREKRERVNRFLRYDDKKLSVLGEKLAREMISGICGAPPHGIVIKREPGGKPYAENAPGIHFSVSHSGEYAVCAVSGRPVGIDIEKIRPVNLKIIGRICSEEEKKYIFGASGNTADENLLYKRFFEIWTAKEAFAKRDGKGISRILQSKNPRMQNLRDIPSNAEQYIVNVNYVCSYLH